MAEPKTKITDGSVEAFLNSVEGEPRRKDAFVLLDLFKSITGEDPRMWGSSMVGFGSYHYKSERSSQEGDWFLVGFSPRKQSLTLYVLPYSEHNPDLLKKLGKHKTGKGCLYINKLADVDMAVLQEIVRESYSTARKRLSAG
jgi:hypothetical protein